MQNRQNIYNEVVQTEKNRRWIKNFCVQIQKAFQANIFREFTKVVLQWLIDFFHIAFLDTLIFTKS